MKQAFEPITIVAGAILILFFIIITSAIFIQFTRGIEKPDSFITQNNQCQVMTTNAFKTGEEWPDTDGDGLADKCDPCPNNYLSKKGETPSTDKDNDGLSEERTSSDYEVNECDADPKNQPAECKHGYDKQRKKCKCGYRFEKDHCATKKEYKEVNREYYSPVVKEVYNKIKVTEFTKALELIKKYKKILQNKEMFEDHEFFKTAETILELYSKKSVTTKEYEALKTATLTEPEIAIKKDPAAVYALKAIGYHKLAITTHGTDFRSVRFYISEAYDTIQLASEYNAKASRQYLAIRDAIYQDAVSIHIRDRDIEIVRLKASSGEKEDVVIVDSNNFLGSIIGLDDGSRFEVFEFQKIDPETEKPIGEPELVVDWYAAEEKDHMRLDGGLWVDDVIINEYLLYLATECQWKGQLNFVAQKEGEVEPCKKISLNLKQPGNKLKKVTVYFPREQIIHE